MENSRFKFRVWNTETNKMITNVKEMGVFALQSIYSIDEFLVIPTNEKYPLMQYTGLKDKNDVEIYEGDIINHNDFIGYVKYINKGNCNVLGYALVSLLNNRVFYMYCDETDNYEVIGNIYENPELLEEKLND